MARKQHSFVHNLLSQTKQIRRITDNLCALNTNNRLLTDNLMKKHQLTSLKYYTVFKPFTTILLNISCFYFIVVDWRFSTQTNDVFISKISINPKHILTFLLKCKRIRKYYNFMIYCLCLNCCYRGNDLFCIQIVRKKNTGCKTKTVINDYVNVNITFKQHWHGDLV